MNAPVAPKHLMNQVSGRLLHAGYQYEGLALDLHGTFDDDEYEVTDIALHGSTVGLWALVEIAFLERLSQWCNDTLPTAAELREASRLDALIDARQKF